MSNTPSVLRLTPAQHARVGDVIRYHRYAQLDVILGRLTEEGISISRSALHRHLVRLRARDGLDAGSGARTIVVIVDLQTGSVRNLRTSATAEVVGAAVAALAPEQP